MSHPDWPKKGWRELPNREERETMADYIERIGDMLDTCAVSGIDRQRLEFDAADAIRAHAMGVRLNG